MNTDTRHTLRQASGVALQRSVLLAAGFVFVGVIPRWMGPHTYGQYSLLLSSTLCFSALSSMGAVLLMTRFVPELSRDNPPTLQRFFSSIVAVRLQHAWQNAAAFAILFLLLWSGHGLLPEPILWMAITGALRTLSPLPYALFLGLNQSARWESGELLRRVLSLILVGVGFRAAGLSGACLGLMATEVLVLARGFWMAREYLSLPRLSADRDFLAPYLRFSSVFLPANLALLLFQQGGPALVNRFSGDFAQTAFYQLALLLYMALTDAIWRLVSAFGPLFSRLRLEEDHAGIRRWTSRLLTAAGAAGALAWASAYTLSVPLVRLWIGPQYEPVAQLLPWLALAAACYVPGALARLLASTQERPRVAVGSAVVQLTAFVTACWWWVPTHGGLGACLAALVSVVIYSAWGAWGMRDLLPAGRWLALAAVAATLSPILWAWESPPLLRFVSYAVAAGVCWAALGIFQPREWRSLRAETAPPRPI